MVRMLLNTTSQNVSLTISKDNRIFFNIFFDASNKVSEQIIDIIEQSLSFSSLKKEDIDELLVITGPGSFTGIRVGVATMQGLSTALSKPLLGISTLDAFALSNTKKEQKVALRLRGKEYVCRQYNFEDAFFSDYYTIMEKDLTEDIEIVNEYNIPNCLINEDLIKFLTEPVPFYYKKPEAERQFDKKSC